MIIVTELYIFEIVYSPLHKFLEKLIFHSIFLFLPLPPIFNVGFDFLDLMAEQDIFPEPTLTTLSWRGGRGEVISNWKERGRGHFRSLENGLRSYKPILRS